MTPNQNTTISVSNEVADELYERKDRGESYDDVLRRLLELNHEINNTDNRNSETSKDTETEEFGEKEVWGDDKENEMDEVDPEELLDS